MFLIILNAEIKHVKWSNNESCLIAWLTPCTSPPLQKKEETWSKAPFAFFTTCTVTERDKIKETWQKDFCLLFNILLIYSSVDERC